MTTDNPMGDEMCSNPYGADIGDEMCSNPFGDPNEEAKKQTEGPQPAHTHKRKRHGHDHLDVSLRVRHDPVCPPRAQHDPVAAAHGCDCKATTHGDFGAESHSGGALKNETWKKDGASLIHEYVQPMGKVHDAKAAPDAKYDLHVKVVWTKTGPDTWSFETQNEGDPGKWTPGAKGSVTGPLVPAIVRHGGPEGVKKHGLATKGGAGAGAVLGFLVGGPVGAAVGAGLGWLAGGKAVA